MSTSITVEVVVDATIEQVWELWNNPAHITKWYFASPEWHAPKATNDLVVGSKFLTRMEAKDGSFGFDYEGTYTAIKELESISYQLLDDRKVDIVFTTVKEGTKVTETFDAENVNPIEMQKAGWQAILNNFKAYAESRK